MSKRTLVASVVVIIGCGNGNPVGGDAANNPDQGAQADLSTSGGPGTPQQFMQDLINTQLDKLKMCCSASDMQTPSYQFGVALLQGFGGLLGQLLQASFDKGRLSFDANAAGVCIAQYQALFAAQQCGMPLMPMQQMLNPCTAITAGKQPAGMPCAFDPECQDGLTCVGYVLDGKGNPVSDGKCTAPPGGGQTCGAGKSDGGASLSFNFNSSTIWGSHPECASGFYCDFSVCTAQKQAGGQCSDDKQCVSGLTCHLGTCGQTGPSAAGAACNGDSDCMAALYCDRPSLKCANRKTAGQSCTNTFSSECLGRCSTPDGGGAGMCVAYCGSL